MKHYEIKLTALNQASFSSYGEVIETKNADHCFMNNGTFRRYHDLANIDIGRDGSAKTMISIAKCLQAVTLPYRISYIERHPLATQLFYPLSKEPMIIVVCQLNNENQPSVIEGFISNGKQGINYHKGVWHMPMISLVSDVEFLIIDYGGIENNCQEHHFTDEQLLITSDQSAVINEESYQH